MIKQPNFFHSQPSTLPKEALAKFYLSMTSGLSFMIRSVAFTRSSTSYEYLFTKIGNSNLCYIWAERLSANPGKSNNVSLNLVKQVRAGES